MLRGRGRGMVSCKMEDGWREKENVLVCEGSEISYDIRGAAIARNFTACFSVLAEAE